MPARAQVTITLSPEARQRLQAKAAATGMRPNRLAAVLVHIALGLPAESVPKHGGARSRRKKQTEYPTDTKENRDE